MPYLKRRAPDGIVLPSETGRASADYQPGEVREYRLSEEQLARYWEHRPERQPKWPVGLAGWGRRRAKPEDA